MSKILEFTEGLDTGEADDASIQPYENGQDATEEVFNRPPEILRTRTEKLRAEAGYRRWVDDADRGVPVLQLFDNGDGVTWNGVSPGGDGHLVIDNLGIYFLPHYGTGEARGEFWEGGGSLYPTQFAHLLTDNGTPGEQDIEWKSLKFDFEGGNHITITVTGSAGYGATTVEVNGDNTVSDPGVQPGQDDIVVQYDTGASVGVDDIISAVNGDSVANQLVTATYASGNSAPAGDPAYDIPTTSLAGGIDAVTHFISAVELDNFFTADAANPLREGDTLAIWYDTPLQRRRSIEENGGEEAIPAASLVNLTAEPDKAPNAVVLGRVIDDEFHFVNGVRITAGETQPSLDPVTHWDLDAREDEIRDDYERPIAAPPAHGVDEGSKRLGVDASTFTQLSTMSESQQEVNEDIDSELATVDGVLATSVVAFSSLQAFIEGTTEGDYGYVQGVDFGSPTSDNSGWESATGGWAGDDIEVIETDGQYLWIAGGAGATDFVNRWDNDTFLNEVEYVSFLSSTPTTITDLATNGQYTCVAYTDGTDALFDVLDVATPGLTGTFTAAGITTGPFHCAFVGDVLVVSAGTDIWTIDPSSPSTSLDTIDWTAQVRALTATRLGFVVTGDAVTDDSGGLSIGNHAGFFGVVPSTGDITILASQTFPDGIPDDQLLVADRDYIYAVNSGATSIAKYSVRGNIEFLVGAQRVFNDSPPAHGLAVDDKYLYAASGDGFTVYDKTSISPVDELSQLTSGGALATDGYYVFQRDETGNTIGQHQIPKATRKWYRTDLSARKYLPYRTKALPAE